MLTSKTVYFYFYFVLSFQLAAVCSLQSLCFGLTSWEMIFTDILFLESVDS